MATTQAQTVVRGMKEVEKEEVKRTRKWLFFFNIDWWETTSIKTIGNDIHIKSNREIRQVFLNGEPLIQDTK